MVAKSRSFEVWLAAEHPEMRCIAIMYNEDSKTYEALLAKRVEVPKSVRVTLEDENKFDADPRKHLLLPGIG